MTVLILATDIDLSADAMVRALRDRGVPVFRADLGWFPDQLGVDAQFENGRWRGRLSTATRALEIADIRSIWYRSPTSFRLPQQMTATERRHAHNEAKLGLGGVLLSLPVLWVNHPVRHVAAGYKPLQLAAAARCGLAVPDTLITNQPHAVRQFAARATTVTKMLGAPAITEEQGRKVAFTEIVHDEHLADLRGIEATAHQFQHWVPKRADARVIVVGRDVFAVLIHAGSAAAAVDWRCDYDALTYQALDPPAAVTAGVRALTAEMGLVYAALDFAVTPEDRWIFLGDLNPGGQYGWLEERAAIPVTATLAGLLAKGPS